MLDETKNDGKGFKSGERGVRLDRYAALRALTEEQRREIFEYCMKRSDEILRGQGDDYDY